MTIYKVGSTKLEPFKPSMKTEKLKVVVVTDSLNRIQGIDVEFTGVKKSFTAETSINEAWNQVEKYFEKALMANKTRQNR